MRNGVSKKLGHDSVHSTPSKVSCVVDPNIYKRSLWKPRNAQSTRRSTTEHYNNKQREKVCADIKGWGALAGLKEATILQVQMLFIVYKRVLHDCICLSQWESCVYNCNHQYVWSDKDHWFTRNSKCRMKKEMRKPSSFLFVWIDQLLFKHIHVSVSCQRIKYSTGIKESCAWFQPTERLLGL